MLLVTGPSGNVGAELHRLFVYLDPDYADADTARYPWLGQGS